MEQQQDVRALALIGIRSRGEKIAQRMSRLLQELAGVQVPVGALDITLYRDDLGRLTPNPVVGATEVPFDVNPRRIIIVDDVLFTGRTIRAALDAIADLGRPESVGLLVLVDRGHRELPIKANYVGKNVPTSRKELVQVRLSEVDGVDEVVIEEGNLLEEAKP